MLIDAHFFPEVGAGGFTRFSGTIEFYVRVNALLRPEMTVLDLGAGRGLIADLPAESMARRLGTLKGKVQRVIAIDVDEAVRTNPIVDEAYVYDGSRLPLEDNSIDIIMSDYVLEHVPNPVDFAREVERVLKPGGFLCARTPNFYSLLVLVSSLTPNTRHTKLLKTIQPDGPRQEFDVFPTCYKLNSKRQIKKFFPDSLWDNFTYTFSPEPSYHFGSRVMYVALMMYQYVKKPVLGGEVLMVFLRKKSGKAS